MCAISAGISGMIASIDAPQMWRRVVETAVKSEPFHWAVAIWAALAVALIAVDHARLAQFFLDTDDATRLIEIRSLMQTGAWFDNTLARFGTDGLVSHWSRLIDAPVALLILFFSIFMPVTAAELAAQAVWPLMLLLPLLVILARTVETLSGRTAAAFALALAATALTALLQFRPGRIDHHNAMIVTTVGSIFLMVLANADNRKSILAGVLAALSLAIGFEALPIVALSSVALVFWAVLDRTMADAVTRYCTAFAATLGLSFAATVPPSHWMSVSCDALSINLLALVASGAAAAVVVLTIGRGWSTVSRLATLAAAGLVGVALYGAIEPACLAGPFGQVPKAIYPIWLDTVSEAKPLTWHFMRMPGLALSIAALLFAGAAAYVHLLRQSIDNRLVYLAVVAVATAVLGIWQFKFVSYATWMAIPALAILISRVEGTIQISRLSMQLIVLFCLSPATLSIAGGKLAKIVVSPASAAPHSAEVAACSAKNVAGALAALPSGLIVTHIDLGPVIVATTHHRALSAPYHRLPDGIIAAHAIFAASPAESRARRTAVGAGYVVDCPHRFMPGVAAQAGSDTLLAGLRDGRVPTWLVDVTPPGAAPLRVWRIAQ